MAAASASCAPAPPRQRRWICAKDAQLRREPAEGVRVDPADDDEHRVDRVRGVDDALDRRVTTQVGNSPTARPKREAEGDQAEVMLLAGKARKQDARTETASPASTESEQPASEYRGREVLLSDRYLASLPAIAQIVQVGEHDLGQHRVERRHAEQRIEDRLGERLVERLQRGREVPADGLGFERHRLLLSGSQRESRGLGRGEPFREVLLHEAHALEVFVGVETKTAGRARWLEQAVPPLPRAKQFRADAGAPAELAYAEEARFHGVTIQHLDSYLTGRWRHC